MQRSPACSYRAAPEAAKGKEEGAGSTCAGGRRQGQQGPIAGEVSHTVTGTRKTTRGVPDRTSMQTAWQMTKVIKMSQQLRSEEGNHQLECIHKVYYSCVQL